MAAAAGIYITEYSSTLPVLIGTPASTLAIAPSDTVQILGPVSSATHPVGSAAAGQSNTFAGSLARIVVAGMDAWIRIQPTGQANITAGQGELWLAGMCDVRFVPAGYKIAYIGA